MHGACRSRATYKMVSLLNQEDALVVILAEAECSVRAGSTSTNDNNILLKSALASGRQGGDGQEFDDGLCKRHDELVCVNEWRVKIGTQKK